jgi:hypothetical protein
MTNHPNRGGTENAFAFDLRLPSNWANNGLLGRHIIRPRILAQRESASEDHKHHKYNLLGKRSYTEKRVQLNGRKSFNNPYIMKNIRYDDSGGRLYSPVRSHE